MTSIEITLFALSKADSNHKSKEKNKNKVKKQNKINAGFIDNFFKQLIEQKKNENLSQKNNEDNEKENQESRPITTGKPTMKLDKEFCEKIISLLPKCSKTNLNNFKKTIKSKTENLNEMEQAFALFNWMGQNIDYDVKNKNLGKKVDCSKEGVFS